MRQIEIKEMSESDPLKTCRKTVEDTETGIAQLFREEEKETQEEPVDCLSGIRHEGGMTLMEALVGNVGKAVL